MNRHYLIVALALVLTLGACPKRSTHQLPEYQLADKDAYLGGTVSDLYETHVLNSRDFVYSIAVDPTSRFVAYSHMVMTDFELSLAQVDGGKVLWHMPLNPTEFDVEGVAFVANNGVVVATRRTALSTHPTMRLFDANTGQQRAFSVVEDERGYTQIASNSSGTMVAGVSYKDGNLVVRDTQSLGWLAEVRAHRGPAVSVAFAQDNTIFTGGQDRSLSHWRLEPMEANTTGTTRMAVIEVGDTKQRAMVVLVGGTTSAVLSLPADLETTAITSQLAERLGLVGSAEKQVKTSSGEVIVKQIQLPPLQFRDFVSQTLPAVICDECVPLGCDAVLGKDAKPLIDVTKSPLPYLVNVELKAAATSEPATESPEAPAPTEQPEDQKAPAGAAGDSQPASGRQLYRAVLLNRYNMPGPVNDIRLSRDGKTLCVALSEAPAERSLELYEKEKEGIYPEPTPNNAAALIDASSGKVLKVFPGHRGFVVTADISPDGKTIASGGWDNYIRLFDVKTGQMVVEHEMAWLARRVRFSPDGRTLAVAAWTPPNAGGRESEPAAVLFHIVYEQPKKFSK